MTVPRSILLATGFPPLVGGIETLLGEISRRLTPNPLVVAPPPAASPKLEVRQVPSEVRGLAGRLAYRAQWALHPSLHYLSTFWRPALDACRAQRPEVIQCGHLYLGPLAHLLSRRLRRPYVVYIHGREAWRGARQGVPAIDAFLRGGVLRGAGAVFVHGDFTAGLARAWGVTCERIVQVPYGAEPRAPVAAPAGARLLSVCRLLPQKGVDTVIRALPGLARHLPAVEYRVVGSGPDEGRLRALASELGVARRITFVGALPADSAELTEEYARCSLFVLPTRATPEGPFEGYGLVFLEAGAHGRPVLAGSTGGERDAVADGETGVLVDGGSPEVVERAIVELLLDPPRLRELGEAGRRRVETTHNWDRAAEVIEEVLTRVARRDLPR